MFRQKPWRMFSLSQISFYEKRISLRGVFEFYRIFLMKEVLFSIKTEPGKNLIHSRKKLKGFFLTRLEIFFKKN